MKKETKSLNIISRMDWLVLLGVFVICLGLFTWMFFGVIDTTVSSVGVVNTKDGSEEWHINGRGVISEILVEKDSYVQEGDPLARVYEINEEYEVTGDLLTIGIKDGSATERTLYSDRNGYISSVDMNEWDQFDITDTLMHICEADSDYKHYVYAKISGSYNDQIVPDKTRAIIVANNHSEDLYGHLTGTVVGKASIPREERSILELTGSQVATDFLLDGEDSRECYIVLIKLDTDPDSGRPLFSTSQPDNELIINEKCDVTFILSQRNPFDKIFNLRGQND